jgi:hypothetical protein
MESLRDLFERWITSPPHSRSIARYGPDGIYPNKYRDHNVQLAWEAWLEASNNAGV